MANLGNIEMLRSNVPLARGASREFPAAPLFLRAAKLLVEELHPLDFAVRAEPELHLELLRSNDTTSAFGSTGIAVNVSKW